MLSRGLGAESPACTWKVLVAGDAASRPSTGCARRPEIIAVSGLKKPTCACAENGRGEGLVADAEENAALGRGARWVKGAPVPFGSAVA